MKKTILFVVLVISGILTQAQSFRLGAGPVLSMPIGSLKDMNSIGIGAELTGTLEFSESFQAFGQVGYQSFLPKSISVLGTTFKGEATSHVPFIFGARYHSNGLLIGAGLGYSIFGDASGFTFSPQVGYSLDKIDILGHFTSTSISGASLSYLGAKVYYKF